ncbi:MAG: hypothetical protein JSR17_04500 [Proteobacteria bacterium]|nr:hypothetical protein [Pseudomonadota bacterium]
MQGGAFPEDQGQRDPFEEQRRAQDYLKQLKAEQQRAQKLAALARGAKNKKFQNKHFGHQDPQKKSKYR